MALTNANTRGNAPNHRLDGLTVHGDLLITGDQGVSVALGVDQNGILNRNGFHVDGSEADYLDGVLAAGGAPSGTTIRSTAPGRLVTISDQSNTYASSGVMHSTAIVLYAGDTIVGMTIRTGSTGLGTPTNWWFALYDYNLNLLTQTADQTNTALAGSTVKDLSFQQTITITTTGVYYAAVQFTCTTMPSLTGTSLFSALSSGVKSPMKQMAQTSGSGLSSTAPSTITSPSSSNIRPYIVLHS